MRAGVVSHASFRIIDTRVWLFCLSVSLVSLLYGRPTLTQYVLFTQSLLEAIMEFFQTMVIAQSPALFALCTADAVYIVESKS